MDEKQINIVEILTERCKECTLYEGDTISLNILMFDRPLEGICFNNNVYFSADELNYIMQKLISKEQECNKLYIQLKADEEYHKEEENNLRKIIKNKKERNIELYKENNQLKVKNEKLKESLKVWKYSDVQHIFKINKYEQTLTEIKEIAEKEVKRAPDGETFSRPEIKQILQKINEVLNGTNP